jgi:hypothetical protein
MKKLYIILIALALALAITIPMAMPVEADFTNASEAKLTASDAAANDYFGYSVSISSDTLVVGALGKDDYKGAAYVFVRSGTIWNQQAELTLNDAAADDFFGNSVSISGDTLVVCAPGKDVYIGAAYVFMRSGTIWSQQAELTASDAAADDFFGNSVSISGDTAVVGDSAKDSNKGAAYVFMRSGTNWSQQAELTASDAAANDWFGNSVSISGDTLVVGAQKKDSRKGAAYVFARSGTIWSQQAELTASDAAANDFFGYSVSVNGDTLVVGAQNKDSSKGAAYVFARSGTIWSQQAELTLSDAAVNDFFGGSASISGNTLVVSTYGKDSNKGAAYVFARSGTIWSQQVELTASDAAAKDWFGNSVSISGDTAVVGDSEKDSNKGAAYIYENPTHTSLYVWLTGAIGVVVIIAGAVFFIVRHRKTRKPMTKG